MRCGISTSCFYPQDTAASLEEVVRTGAPVTEVFLNTFSELEAPYLHNLAAIAKAGGVEVVSVHPFTSVMEGFFFATPYEGRLRDGLDLYRRYFEACAVLGAKKLVFHGDHKGNPSGYTPAMYAQSFCEIAAIGREYGVDLCHENVVYCRLHSPAAVARLRPLLGEYAAFTLDTKQMHRAGAPMQEMLAAMNGGIRHVHLSDFCANHDCIPPGEGDFDTPAFIRGLLAQGYAGDLVIELYSDGFENAAQLVAAMEYVNRLIRHNLHTGKGEQL